jgi:hypothetical protein
LSPDECDIPSVRANFAEESDDKEDGESVLGDERASCILPFIIGIVDQERNNESRNIRGNERQHVVQRAAHPDEEKKADGLVLESVGAL